MTIFLSTSFFNECTLLLSAAAPLALSVSKLKGGEEYSLAKGQVQIFNSHTAQLKPAMHVVYKETSKSDCI